MIYNRNFIINPGSEFKNRKPLLMWTAIHFDIVAPRDGIITHANSKRHLLYLCSVIHHALWLVYGFYGAECELRWCEYFYTSLHQSNLNANSALPTSKRSTDTAKLCEELSELTASPSTASRFTWLPLILLTKQLIPMAVNLISIDRHTQTHYINNSICGQNILHCFSLLKLLLVF